MGLRTEVQATLMNAGLGLKVPRAAAADAVGPTALYTIAGGLVLVTNLIGLVTTLRAGALATQVFSHTIGPTVLCVATNCIASPVGTIVSVSGNVLDNLAVSVPVGGVSSPIQGSMVGSQNVGAPVQQYGMIMDVGNITTTITVVTGGATRYVLFYIPIDDGATVVAV